MGARADAKTTFELLHQEIFADFSAESPNNHDIALKTDFLLFHGTIERFTR